MKTEIKINNRWDELPPEIQLEMTHLINSIASPDSNYYCDEDIEPDMTGQDGCDGSTPAADMPTHEY